MLLDFLHLATLPSKKSNINPARGSRCAIHRYDSSFVRRYRADENTENEPQTPFIMVTRSASLKFLYVGEVYI